MIWFTLQAFDAKEGFVFIQIKMYQRENMTELKEVPANFGINDATINIYTYVMFTVLCQLINIFGIVTNSINISCFVKQGFKDSINVSLMGKTI